jgi:hypothetical protein
MLAARPRFRPVVGKDRVRFLVAVTGHDGHLAVLSWGEIDPRYGHPLHTLGPQRVVSGDPAGGRNVSRIASIWTVPPPSTSEGPPLNAERAGVLPDLPFRQVIQAGGGQVQHLVALGRVLVRCGGTRPHHEPQQLPVVGVDGQRGGVDGVVARQRGKSDTGHNGLQVSVMGGGADGDSRIAHPPKRVHGEGFRRGRTVEVPRVRPGGHPWPEGADETALTCGETVDWPRGSTRRRGQFSTDDPRL